MKLKDAEHKNRLSYQAVLAILAAALIVAVIGSFSLGRYPVSLDELWRVVCGGGSETARRIVVGIRLPRILLGCLVGCSLSAAGASYQGVFQNAMAAPDILGASAGAAFGAALAIFFYQNSQIVMLSAFVFGIITVGLVIFISTRAKGKRVLGLILSGIMIGSLFSSGTSFIKLVADTDDQLPAITYWLMGSLNGKELKDVIFAAIPMIIGLIPLYLVRWRINILTLGDEEARTMGVNAKRLRFIVILASTLVTAASVAVSGMIGWVGLVIPHLARRMVGNNYKHLMPATMLFGALFLLIVDNICRNALTVEIPIGILTAFIGAPFFIYLITREGERY